jgi:hypothetical protein
MADLLASPLSSLNAAGIHELVRSGYPESARVEFKEKLPSKDGLDPWHRGEDRIGDRARDSLLAEVVSFANANGGLLFVGIEESESDPHRAVAVTKIRSVATLAERFSLQIRDCVDPPLLGVHCAGIEMDAEGAGVLAVRVPASPRAPHRLITTKEAYQRVGPRTAKMDMRAIHDLVLVRFTASAQLEQAFAAMTEAARLRSNRFAAKRHQFNVVSISVHCIPATHEIALASVYGNPSLRPSYGLFNVLADDREVRLDIPTVGLSERPILRGSRHFHEDPSLALEIELKQDGSISYQLMYLPLEHMGESVAPENVLGLLTNAMRTIHRVEIVGEVTAVEYAIEVAIERTNGSPLEIARFGTGERLKQLGIAQANPLILPRIFLGRQPPDTVLHTTLQDLYHSCGSPLDVSSVRDRDLAT